MELFLNLTNGLEYLNDWSDGERHPFSFVRIQSTTIERKNWGKLFADLDHNFLFNLAIGKECVLVDYGAQKDYSKTLYYGVPLITCFLNRFWYGREEFYRFSRGNLSARIFDVESYYRECYADLFLRNSTKEKERIKEKLKYYRKFLLGGEVKLVPMGWPTTHDGDFEYYKKIAEKL